MYGFKELNAVEIAQFAYETDRAFMAAACKSEIVSWDELSDMDGSLDKNGKHPVQNEWICRVRKEIKRRDTNEGNLNYGSSNEDMLRAILFSTIVKIALYTRDGIPGM